jgi:hypothetical protein
MVEEVSHRRGYVNFNIDLGYPSVSWQNFVEWVEVVDETEQYATLESHLRATGQV